MPLELWVQAALQGMKIMEFRSSDDMDFNDPLRLLRRTEAFQHYRMLDRSLFEMQNVGSR